MGWAYEVKAGTSNGSIESSVKNRNGHVCFSLSQTKYNIAELDRDPQFSSSLKHNQQGTLRSLYRSFSPRVVADVVQREAPKSKKFRLGAVEFECPPEDLFAALVEVIYQMRCALFHGELIPTKDATACYEPAYRVVRRFLDAIR